MKKMVFLLAMMLALAGCGGEEEPVFETIGESAYEPAAVPDPTPISVWIPDEAAAQTSASGDSAEIYTWQGHELRIETMTGGDIGRTLETLTGLSADSLTVMHYEKDGVELYQTVWSAAGEEGILLGRCLVADDGNYHYCVSLVSPEESDGNDVYAEICSSFSLGEKDAAK